MFSVALLCSGECVQVGPQQFGRVEVSAFSIPGERLSTLDIDLLEVGTHKSFKSLLKGAVAAKIPVWDLPGAGFGTRFSKIRARNPFEST